MSHSLSTRQCGWGTGQCGECVVVLPTATRTLKQQSTREMSGRKSWGNQDGHFSLDPSPNASPAS